jgi:outer membrane protein, heavy metal efflux system
MTRSFITVALAFLLTSFQADGQKTYTLKAALEKAASDNPMLRVSSLTVDAAEADITSAAIRPNPIFNFQALHISNANSFAEGTRWNNGLNTQYWYQVTKPLQVAGQRSNKIELSQKILTQTKLDFRETSRQLYAQVANQWLNIWAAQINLDILLRGKNYIDSLVTINGYRLRDKVITSTDLSRTELLQQQYLRDIISARQQVNTETQYLKFMLGEPDSLAIDMSDNTFSTISTAGDSLVLLGLTQRPDVLSAKTAIDISKANIRLQKSNAYPIPEVGGMVNPQNRVPYLGLYGTIEIPIFNRNQGQREKAIILKYQSESNLWAIERQAETEVMIAYRSYTTQRQNLASYERNLAKAQEILTSVRYSYLKGATSIIDLLEAQRSWLDTQQRYYQTTEDLRRSYIQLLFTTGLINQLAQ